jgi:hypothetical protein
MTDDRDKYPDYLAGSDFDDDMDLSIDELEVRLEQLEDQVSELGNQLQTSQTAGIGFYGLGTAIAVVLSWSRNVSILWCILHGIISWIYVAYFAFTR